MNVRHRSTIALVLIAAALLPLAGAPIVARAVVVPTITAIASGYGHTCALTGGGGINCWGGAVANGQASASLMPVSVVGLESGVSAIAAGLGQTCVVTTAGGAKCFGRNDHGQLGDGTTSWSLVPLDVVGLGRGVRGIATGRHHSCAVTSGGGVKCWGWNHSGQLGDGTTTDRLTPVLVSGLTGGVVAIAVGYIHTCALTVGGRVMCWGGNYLGQLGNGTTTDSLTPVDVSGLSSGVTRLAVGFSHSCVATSAGTAKCWGYNSYGKLGNGSTTRSVIPVDVVGLGSRIVDIAVGSYHSCAVTHAGAVRCWGYNGYGQLGDGTTSTRLTSVAVSGLASGIRAVSVGEIHTCALTSAGGVRCWGSNADGRLGHGSRSNSKIPVAVDFATHQAIDLGASAAAGSIAPGTAVTFTATVRPLGPAGERAIVRFEIYRQDDGVWRRTAHRDVAADATGRATLRWTFVTTGSRYVRAQALATATYAASPWSSRFDYTVS